MSGIEWSGIAEDTYEPVDIAMKYVYLMCEVRPHRQDEALHQSRENIF